MSKGVPSGEKTRAATGGLRMLATATGLVFVSSATAAALSVVGQSAILRGLGLRPFGDYNYILAWCNVLVLVALVGTDTASLRFVPEYAAKGEHDRLGGYLRWSMRSALLASCALAALWLLGVLLVRTDKSPSLVATAIAGGVLIPVATVLRVYGGHAQGAGRAVESQAVQGVVRGGVFIAIIAALISVGVLSPARAIMANTIAAIVAIVVLARRSTMSFLGPLEAHPVDRALWWRTSLPFLMIGIAQQLLASTDILLLGYLRDTSASGLYVTGSQFAMIVGLGVAALNSIVAPSIAARWAEADLPGLRAVIGRGRVLVMGFSLAVAIVLVAAGRPLLAIYGLKSSEIDAAYPVLLVLLVGQLLMSAQYAAGFLLTMTGHERIASRTIVSMAILNLILNLALIPFLGAIGAATATAIAVGARAIVLSRYSGRLLAGEPVEVAR